MCGSIAISRSDGGTATRPDAGVTSAGSQLAVTEPRACQTTQD
ncbi:hypothetical protein [Lysobacter gummosus]